MRTAPQVLSLQDFDGNRNNNFTLIRLVFAWLVLFGHSFAIQPTHGLENPLNAIFQGSVWIGEFAVNGFFVISGFLVCASLQNRGVKDYVISRTVRILPALVVCVAVSVFVLGPLLTTFPLAQYIQHPGTLEYLKNAIVIFGMEWSLPGVFEENRRIAINGSLWTLTVEAYCYIILAVFGFWGFLKNRLLANLSVAGVLAFSYYHFNDIPLLGVNDKWSRPSLYFLTGIFFYHNRRDIPIDSKFAIISIIIMYLSFGEEWFAYVFPVFFAYAIFFLAYGVKHINIDNSLGDVSYGVYIYAWPVQQVVAQFFPSLNPYTHTLVATPVVFGLAYLSWSLVEKPALGFKKSLMAIDGNFLRARFAALP